MQENKKESKKKKEKKKAKKAGKKQARDPMETRSVFFPCLFPFKLYSMSLISPRRCVKMRKTKKKE